MSFDTPAGLLLLAAVPLAAVLLLRGLRRRERPIAAFFLLRELIEALPPLPRSFLLRRRIQVLLFLAALACAALAAAGPVIGRADDPPQRVVLLVDHLALRRDARGLPAAWTQVTAAAARFARSFRGDDRILLVRSDTGVVGGGPLPPRRAAALAQSLLPSALPASPATGADLLGGLEKSFAPALIGIVTPDPARWQPLVRDRGPKWRVFAAGAAVPGPNHALLDVEVRPELLRAGRVALFCRTKTFGPLATSVSELTLTVRLDGALLARRTFRSAPGETQVEVFPALEAGPGLLEIALDPEDAFPEDNHFAAPLSARAAVPARLVTEGNPPLEAALRSLPGLELTVAGPSAAVPAGQGSVQVYDRVAPRETTGNILAIAPPAGLPGIGYRGDAPHPREVRADATSFLLQGVVLENLRIARLPIYEVPSGMEVLATVDGYPLLATGRGAGGGRMVLLAFDPLENDWVFDPSYPILIANAVSWLAESPEGTRSSFLVGDALPGALAAGLRALVDPVGRRWPAPPDGWDSFRFPLPGRWRVEGSGPATSGDVFVNLLDESVSGSQGWPAVTAVTAATAPEVPQRPFRAQVRNPLLVAALALLLLERIVAPPRRPGRFS